MLESEIPPQFAPSTTRLVIRVKLPQPSPPPVRPRLSRGALLLIVGVVSALLLGWFGISTLFKSDRADDAGTIQPSPKLVAETAVPSTAEIEPRSVEPEVSQQPDAPTSAINEVIPDVPQSALDTIRGTIRVSVRVSIDKQGSVFDTTAVDRGPSRYFERLAVGASKQWTFTPANSAERRTMLVKFNFTRTGVTAEASAAD